MEKLNSILLIDDDDNFNILHNRLLTKMNVTYHIEIATNGQQAINFLASKDNLEANCPDLIFVDIDMPVMDGWNFILEYEMLMCKVFSKAVIVMFTSNSDEAVRQKVYSIDFIDDFLLKPLTGKSVNYILDKHF